MSRSVTVTTPIPTLEEFGEDLGLTKARQRALAPLFVERRTQGDYTIKRSGAAKASAVFPTQAEAVERARQLRPNGNILVERVRQTTGSDPSKWRKP